MQSPVVRSLLIPLLVAFVTANGQEPPAPAPAPARLSVVVLEGEGAINNIKRRTSRETIVKVEDENHKPLAGVAVAFLLPADGPGGAFTGGAKSVTVNTDSAGRAVMPHLQVNSNPGTYRIGVYASHRGLGASATISQSSITGAAAVSTAGIIGIVAGVAAAGGVALAVVSKGKGNGPGSSQTGTTTTGTVGTGGGTTFGPPH
ncbi:MAG TPA: hypothetical protein VMH81_36115 [Bryobacteraceae bacterium]|nr:hypothetical protein [Bryobacteraceae bacterium]